MKIAVTYENGQVFQHFGHTEQFKIYTVDDENILSSEIVNMDGTGHGALADFLKERGVNVLICGGIGAGAVMAPVSYTHLDVYKRQLSAAVARIADESIFFPMERL